MGIFTSQNPREQCHCIALACLEHADIVIVTEVRLVPVAYTASRITMGVSCATAVTAAPCAASG